MSDFLQRLCPKCGEEAISIAQDIFSTRTCAWGHTWSPSRQVAREEAPEKIYNPEPSSEPALPEESEE